MAPLKFWQNPTFEALNAEWREVLIASGFKDAEVCIRGEMIITRPSCMPDALKSLPEVIRESKLAYFQLLSTILEERPKFEDQSDWLIMVLTSKGQSISEISKELLSRGLRKHNRDTIRYIRRRYEHKWGIRAWTPEQMVSRRPPTR